MKGGYSIRAQWFGASWTCSSWRVVERISGALDHGAEEPRVWHTAAASASTVKGLLTFTSGSSRTRSGVSPPAVE